MAISYKQSGVDIDRGDALVDWLKTLGPGPHQKQIVSGIGGFAALFKTDFARMKEPTLVSCTDGVGTKLKLASHFNSFGSIGQDLVAMNVNDLICCGAQPLFFLDYYSTGRLELTAAQEFLKGVRRACDQSDLALIGGETAEMPGMYHGNDFDCAGFCVGVVDLPETLGPHRVQVGSKLVGIASSGFHSNGYSLLRQVFGADLEENRAILMEPTALYVALSKALKELNVVQAFAHITGGGIWNLLRVVPSELGIKIRPWPVPEAFVEVRRRAELPWSEMLKTLNCGVGFVAIVSPSGFEPAMECVRKQGFKAFDLGEVVTEAGPERLQFDGKQFDD